MFRAIALLVMVSVAVPGLFAQRRPRAPGRDQQVRMLDRLAGMSPEEREQFLRGLPPERRARLERRLDRYTRLSPEERRRLGNRFRRFRELPPERQDEARRLFRRLSALAPARRVEIRREFVSIRRMDGEARRARLRSPEFRSRYSLEERRLIEDLTSAVAPPE